MSDGTEEEGEADATVRRKKEMEGVTGVAAVNRDVEDKPTKILHIRKIGTD